jgi:hypothetical protein
MRTRALRERGDRALQNLSCGYFCCSSRRSLARTVRLRSRGAGCRRVGGCVSLAIAAVAILVVTWPFLSVLRCARAQRRGPISGRGRAVLEGDVYAFGTASASWLLEHVQAFPKAEGQGFPGFTILAFSIVAALFAFRRARAVVRSMTMADWQRIAGRVMLVLFLADVLLLLVLLIFGSLPFMQHGQCLQIAALTRRRWTRCRVACAVAGCAQVRRWVRRIQISGSMRARRSSRRWRSAASRIGRTPLGTGPYYWLQLFVPGTTASACPRAF